MNKALSWLAATVLGGILIYFSCSTITPFPQGGSGTETVGILVDTAHHPVAGARVSVYPSQASAGADTLYTLSDTRGHYTFIITIPRKYALKARTLDNALVFDTTFIKADTINKTDLGTRIMHKPGAIFGRVLLNNTPKAGVLLFIPGTTHIGTSNDMGYFLLDRIPRGSHFLHYRYEKYIEGIDTVMVKPGDTTRLSKAKNLTFDPSGPPPAPTFVNAQYDTASGTVRLSWQRVTVSDFKCYKVYKDTVVPGTDTTMYPVLTTKDTAAALRLFASCMDTNSSVKKFHVRAMDTTDIESGPSPVLRVNAVSPTWVRTLFTWIKIPNPNDTVTNKTRVTLVVSYSNRTRENNTIRWLTGTGVVLDTIRTVAVHRKQGIDTLVHQWKDTGSYIVQTEACDIRGCVWYDSCKIMIRESTVLVQPNTWKSLPSMHTKRRQHAMVMHDNTLYAVGGAIDSPTGAYDEYALSSCEALTVGDTGWKNLPVMPTRRFCAGAAVVKDKIYVIGGSDRTVDHRSVEIFNTQTQTWDSARQIPDIRVGHACCAFNDLIYSFGGSTDVNFTITPQINVYDPSTGTWTAVGAMRSPRIFHQVALVNDKIYIIGGIDDVSPNMPLAAIEVFDPKNNECTVVATMNTPRACFSCGVIGGKIYIVGGWVEIYPKKFTNSVMEFDPMNPGQFIDKKELGVLRHRASACTNGSFLFLSGGSTNGTLPYGQTNDVLRFNP